MVYGQVVGPLQDKLPGHVIPNCDKNYNNKRWAPSPARGEGALDVNF